MEMFVVAAGKTADAVNTHVPPKTKLFNVMPSIVTMPPPRLEPAKKPFRPITLPLTHGKQAVAWNEPGSPDPPIEKLSPKTV
jgi:hypothetical protein